MNGVNVLNILMNYTSKGKVNEIQIEFDCFFNNENTLTVRSNLSRIDPVI